MKKMNFEQMEVIGGGQTQMANMYVSDIGEARTKVENCAALGAIVLASAICTIGGSALSGGLLTGIGWGLTAWAYKDYFMCQYNKMN